VPDKLAARINALAQAEGRSNSDIVREAIEDLINAKRQRSPRSGYDLEHFNK
jgi:predicted DNA-binding protein